MKRTLPGFLSLFFIVFFNHAFAQSAANSNSTVNLTDLKFTVSEATDWTGLLVRKSGWFGADGIYTIPLNGIENKHARKSDKVLFIFSDSMIGEIGNDNKLQPGYTMTHNTVALLDGNQPIKDHMHFYWAADTNGRPKSIFSPTTPQTQKGDYYWLGDAFINNEAGNATYIFGYRIHNVASGAFGFKEVGNALIKIPAGSQPPYKDQQQMDTPFYITDAAGGSGSFGAGIYVNTKSAGAIAPDGYIYVYGVRGKAKSLMIARVLPGDFENFSRWTYWNGKNWVADIQQVAAVTDHLSNELSLTALPDGRYALVFQVDGISATVGLRIGATPYGPFGPIIKIWDCKPDMLKSTYIVYNAKAHPVISKPGELIITYNINSVEFDKDLQDYPNLYRPRFIRLKFQ